MHFSLTLTILIFASCTNAQQVTSASDGVAVLSCIFENLTKQKTTDTIDTSLSIYKIHDHDFIQTLYGDQKSSIPLIVQANFDLWRQHEESQWNLKNRRRMKSFKTNQKNLCFYLFQIENRHS